jgi:uncharacterized protein YecE (DUF72 family)
VRGLSAPERDRNDHIVARHGRYSAALSAAHKVLRVGTAGWRIAKQHRESFALDGSSLERYTARLNCVEINSSFHRAHRTSTYARWAQSVPANFLFSLKVPKEITHKRRLVDCLDLLETFLEDTAALGDHLGPYVVQLAPSHAFNDDAEAFLQQFRARYSGGIVCEPRHVSWAQGEAAEVLRSFCITRAGADPAPFAGAERSDPFGGFSYYRWHGSPRMYYSQYDETRLRQFAEQAAGDEAGETWCIFDNTAMDGATGNALHFVTSLSELQESEPARFARKAVHRIKDC